MKLVALALAAAGLIVATAASGGTATHEIRVAGEVLSLAADGGTVAVRSTALGDCGSALLWSPSSGTVALGDARCGSTTASDAEYESLALAGARAVWVDYDFGNHAYCSGPYTATRARPAPASFGRCPEGTSDVLWSFAGGGGLLAATSGLHCDFDCGPNYDFAGNVDLKLWRVKGAVLSTLGSLPDRATLADVDAGRILVQLRDASLRVLDATGATVGEFPARRGVAKLAGSGEVVVLKGTTLAVYEVAGGAPGKTYTVPAQSRLPDAEELRVAYLSPGAVHVLDLTAGRDKVVVRQKGIVALDLEPQGLFYAWNDPGGGSRPGHVDFLPLAG